MRKKITFDIYSLSLLAFSLSSILFFILSPFDLFVFFEYIHVLFFAFHLLFHVPFQSQSPYKIHGEFKRVAHHRVCCLNELYTYKHIAGGVVVVAKYRKHITDGSNWARRCPPVTLQRKSVSRHPFSIVFFHGRWIGLDPPGLLCWLFKTIQRASHMYLFLSLFSDGWPEIASAYPTESISTVCLCSYTCTLPLCVNRNRKKQEERKETKIA